MRPETRKRVAIGLVVLAGAAVTWRLLVALKLVLVSIPLIVIALWLLLIPVKLAVFLKVRDWLKGTAQPAI